MSIILDGKQYETPGLDTISYADDPAVPQATDFQPRRERIKWIVIHTVHGKRCAVLRPGFSKPSKRAEQYAIYQANTSREVSWDITIDTDGTIIQSNDPVRRYTWHAGAFNPFSVGIELVQEGDGTLYGGQMDVLVRFLDFITRILARLGHPIQRQVPAIDGNPAGGVVRRILDAAEARKTTGICGHRNQTTNRGPGDPTDFPFLAMMEAGYKGFDFDKGEDITFWKGVQTRLGVAADGNPGPGTAKAIRDAGHNPAGLWVVRPGDSLPA